MNKKYYCPANAWDCPCQHKDGSCDLENPAEECDEAGWGGKSILVIQKMRRNKKWMLQSLYGLY